MKREIKFRAWVKYRTDNRWEWAYSEAEKLRLEYDETAEKRDLFLYQWDKEHPQEDRYSYKEYMTNLDEVSISLSGKLVRLINLEVLDIMQFTGLHDKNGKEIYEGDIVAKGHLRYGLNPHNKKIGLVVYKAPRFELDNLFIPSPPEDGCRGCSSEISECLDVTSNRGENILEIIGNIHENPELLGGVS